MDRFTSPIFLSINESGQLEDGLGGVPDFQEGRSILFVGNHQLLGIDMPILVSRLRSRKLAENYNCSKMSKSSQCATGDLLPSYSPSLTRV